MGFKSDLETDKNCVNRYGYELLLLNIKVGATKYTGKNCIKAAMYTLFYKKHRSGLSTQSFLAFCDFEYSKFLNSFLTFFQNRTTGKKHGFIVENK